MKLRMLKGLPASGKSTYAKELAASGGWMRVNKDELRLMMHAGKWSKPNEREVMAVRDGIIMTGFRAGKNVVVDDTNFSPIHERRFRELAKEYGATFETKFFDTPVEECIKRDLQRDVSVGERVIRRMYKDFVAPKPATYTPPAGKPKAIICDVDGTLAHMKDRSPYEWKKVGNDTIDEEVADVLNRYSDHVVVLLSGRDAVCRPETEEWLKAHNVHYDLLLMRPENDTRKDSIVKKELFDNHVRGNYQVKFILDDRDQVVKMWRENGLKVLQVAEGNF